MPDRKRSDQHHDRATSDQLLQRCRLLAGARSARNRDIKAVATLSSRRLHLLPLAVLRESVLLLLLRHKLQRCRDYPLLLPDDESDVVARRSRTSDGRFYGEHGGPSRHTRGINQRGIDVHWLLSCSEDSKRFSHDG